MTMTSRGLLNLLLLLGVAGLALVAVYKPGIEPAAPPVKLTAVMPEQIKRIQITRPGKDPITLLKKDGHWRITAPRDLPADDGRINSLLRLVQETSQTRFPAKTEDLHKYKLDRPAVKLGLDDLEFIFGDTDPINGRRYVQLGTTVHLITDMYFYQIDADLPAFVSTHLLPGKASITSLTLPKMSLRRDAQDQWQLQPDQRGISADAIQTLITAWQESTALWVKPYEKGTALGKITIQLETPVQHLQFDIMATEPELILARPDLGLQYHLNPDTAKTLLELPEPIPPEVSPAVDAKVPGNNH